MNDPGKEEEITLEQYNEELSLAEEEIELGEFYTHQEAIEILKAF